jgi:hypothetical protein
MSLVVLLMLAVAIFSGGCIRMIQNETESYQGTDVPSHNTTGGDGAAGIPETASGFVQTAPPVEMTPAKSEVVTVVEPILTPDPYPILHGVRINDTPQYNPLDRIPEFEKSYHMTGYATGLLVNVVEGPLYIVYVVTPEYDCLKNPDSCRGTLQVPVNPPYMKMTVRDNQTREIVAEDGYAREFSSDTGRYEFSITTQNADGSTTTSTTTPGPRYIAIYKEGVYHITLEGNYLDVNVKILTGATPSRLDIGNGDSSASGRTPPEDEFG